MFILKLQRVSLLIHVFVARNRNEKKALKITMDGIGDVFLIGSVRLTLLDLSVLGCPFLPSVALAESELTRASQLSAKPANRKSESTFMIIVFFLSSQGITIRPLVEFLDVKRSNKKQPAVSEEIYNRVCCSLSIVGDALA